MRILVDLTYIGIDARSGIDTYAMRLIRGWIDSGELDKEHISFVVTNHNEKTLRNIYPNLDYIILNLYSLYPFTKLFTLINRYRWRKLIDNLNYDRVFIPFPTALSSGYIKTKKIVTIHDLQAAKIYKGIKRILQGQILKQAILNSDKIIAISNYTKKNICEYCKKVDKDKIVVIYNSVIVAPQALSIDETLVSDYILYVNTLTELKNIKTLLLAFNEIKEVISNDLLIVGKMTSYWVTEMIPLINQLGLQNRVIHISRYLSNEELTFLYKRAAIFVSPSQHEGFGYTPIEAAINMTPVITSTSASLPEVTKNLLSYYHPVNNYKKLSDIMLSKLRNRDDYNNLKKISEIFSREYAYTSQALKVLNSVINC